MIGKFILTVCISILLFSGNVMGQDLLPIKKTEFVDGKFARKQAFEKIKQANVCYEKGIGYVTQSLHLFLSAYESNKTLPELNYNIGLCYLIVGPRAEALPYFLSAQSMHPNLNEDIHFLIALAYKYQYNFSESIVHFKMCKELIEQNHYREQKELLPICEKHIQECRNAKFLMENRCGPKVQILEGKLNSEFDEFNPQMLGADLFFSSRRGMIGDARSSEDQKYFEKLFSSSKKEHLWDQVKQEENNLGGNSNCTLLTKINERQFVFYNSKSGSGDLFWAEKVKNKWKLGKGLNFMNEKYSRESSASVPKLANEIYFVSNRKGGFGACDIYFCKKDSKSKWSKPMNIGGDINTKYDEGDVFINADGSKLFFSSKGHNSMGGYDIFSCERQASGEWGRPKNLGFPLNSVDNDITYSENEDGVFYFASDRSGGKGGFDIYCEKELEPAEEELVVEKDSPVEEIPEAKIEVPVSVSRDLVEDATNTVKQKLVEEDFVYRVQIAACRKEMDSKDIYKRYKGEDVVEHLFVENWHKYTIGRFLTYKEAANYRDNCGVKDAFVVLFKGGYRLGIARKPFGAN
jgi:tetratricopeptide (TPR) repeat protein